MEDFFGNKEDKEAVCSLCEGDQKAFEFLYNKYSRKVYSFAYSYFKSKEKSEEIVQESFYRIWKNKNNLSSQKSFNSYVLTIAKNLIIDDLRRDSVAALFKNTIGKSATINNNETEDQVIYADLQEIARIAINSLPPKRKEIYYLSRNEQMSNKDISKHLGISLKTVESQMSKALKYIHNILRLNADFIVLILIIF